MTIRRHRVFCVALLVAAMLLVTGCASAEKPVRILFVGNSYTYYNNMPAIAEQLYESVGDGEMEVGMLVQGGQSLSDAAGPRLSELTRLLLGGRWDYVILQEQSTLGGGFRNGMPVIGAPERFHEAVRALDAEIRGAGGKTVLLVTWARAHAPEQQEAITSAYLAIAKELDLIVVPAGPAWGEVLSGGSGISLHQDDGSHPNPIGSYLTACVLLETLFEVDLARAPTTVSVPDLLSPGRRGVQEISVDPEVAAILHDVAEKVGAPE